MNRRQGILHCADVVDAVAIHAGRDCHIAGSQTLAMDAGLIKLELIDALLRPELPHEVGIAMTARAELRYVGTRRLSDEALGFAHRDCRIVAGPIAAVAVGAPQSIRDVDVILDQERGLLGGSIHHRVAFHAAVLANALTQQAQRYK